MAGSGAGSGRRCLPWLRLCARSLASSALHRGAQAIACHLKRRRGMGVSASPAQILMALGACSGPGPPVQSVHLNVAKRFAFLDMCGVEEASNAMALDGVSCLVRSMASAGRIACTCAHTAAWGHGESIARGRQTAPSASPLTALCVTS